MDAWPPKIFTGKGLARNLLAEEPSTLGHEVTVSSDHCCTQKTLKL